MIYRLRHRTSYGYGEPVDVAHHELHLVPRAFAEQRVLAAAVRIDPPPTRLNEAVDHFGNRVGHISIEQVHRTLVVELTARVDVSLAPPPPAEATPPWERIRDQLAGEAGPFPVRECEFALESPLAPTGPALAAYAEPSFAPGRPILAALLDLTRRIHGEFAYDPAATDVSTPLAQVMAERRGVCQDFAHLEVAALRSVGLAAAYVSGYIRTRPPPGRERLRGADASHAWAAVWCGDAVGWVHVDPTNNMVAREDHVVSAWGRDYSDVGPVRGVILGGGVHSLAVAVDLVPETK